MIRTFIALALAAEIKNAIAEYLQPLGKLANGISWAKTENLHLTLKFLGDTPAAQIPEIGAALDRICTSYEPVRAQISGSGVFPNKKHPRVIWLGLKTETDRLVQLAKAIDAACVRFGFQSEMRPFAPHLTVGRVRAGTASAVIQRMEENLFSSPEMVFHECLFMKSELHPAGSIYTPLQKIPFARVTGC